MTRRKQPAKRERTSKLQAARLPLAALLLLSISAAARAQVQSPDLLPRKAEPQHLTRHRIVVSIPDHKLALVENGEVLKVYSVAVGAPESPSPSGEYRIISRLTDPTYFHPHVVIPPGPGNPLGPRWIGLDAKGYGIHGTNQPESIGHSASRGCIRMRNSDVKELFELVHEGDFVELHDDRDPAIVRLFHRDAAPSSESPTVTSVLATANPATDSKEVPHEPGDERGRVTLEQE